MIFVEKYANAHFGKTHFFRHPVLLTKENSYKVSLLPLANRAPNPEIENRCGGILNIDAAALSNCMVNASQEEDIQGNTLYINIKFKIIYHFYQYFSDHLLSRDFVATRMNVTSDQTFI